VVDALVAPAVAALGFEGAVAALDFEKEDDEAAELEEALEEAPDELLEELLAAELGWLAALTGVAPTTLGDLVRFWRAAFMAATFFCHSSIARL
jgi:hypothetical protein